jgi:type IV pilus assembly protein PilW
VVALGYGIGTGMKGEPALFRGNDELVEGAESLQILYGEDTSAVADGIPDVYSAADAVVNWDRIASVRIGLLLRSIDQAGSEVNTDTYDVNGTVFDPPDDRRRRQVFSATVQLRNRPS